MLMFASSPVKSARNGSAYQLWSGSRQLTVDFFGVSNWYVPWDATKQNPPVGTYSFNRYCHAGSSPSNDYAWEVVEATQGVYNWTVFDQWVDAHYANGTELLMELARAPAWATGAGNNVPPTNMAYFADWVETVGTRYAGKVRYWFVRNEPVWGGTTSEWIGTAAKYAEMTRIASQILKDIDPSNKVIGPEASQHRAYTWDSVLIPGLTASAQGYDAGFGDGAGTTMADWIDALSFHTYFDWPTQSPVATPALISAWQLTQQQAAIYAPGKPFWATEWMNISNSLNETSDAIELPNLWRQMVLAAAFGAEKFAFFGWGGSDAPWNKDTQAGATRRQWWADAVEWLTAAPIVRLELSVGGVLTVVRADGATRET